MSCEILTESVLEAALRHELAAGERAALLRHLREPCDACLDLLEGWTAEEMMLAPGASLSSQEREDVFAAIAPLASEARPSPTTRSPTKGRWPSRLFWGAAVAAAALVGVATLLPAPQRDEGVGLKGAAPPRVTLIAFAGVRTPAPHVVRALAHEGSLSPGEVLLLRIRLDAPAWIYLLSQKEGEAPKVIWPQQDAARHDAGEFEVAESGAALAIDPRDLGVDGRLLLIASPAPIGRRQLQVRNPLHTREDMERAFAGCAVDLFPVIVEPR